MTVQEKRSKIDDAIFCVEDARSSILPLSYENEDMAKAQSILLEARDALQVWYDTLADPDKCVSGNEKRYIMGRLQKVYKYLKSQIDDYESGSVRNIPEEASENVESAIKSLL